MKSPKVFISYSHQTQEYNTKVLDFCNKLRVDGIDANIDQFIESPVEGWPRWMNKQIQSSDFVIIMSSKAYFDRANGDEKGDGTIWESGLVFQELSETALNNKKYMAAFFDEDEKEYILPSLKSYTYYNVSDSDRYETLRKKLLGISNTNKAPLGPIIPFDKKEPKTLFVSSPVDIKLWNKATWSGALYMFPKSMSTDDVPIIGLVFENYEAGKAIFHNWKQHLGNENGDKLISISFVTPPFPNDSWILTSNDRNRGMGYFIHIGPNISEVNRKANLSGISNDELLIATLSRYQWVNELPESCNRKTFQQFLNSGKGFNLVAAHIHDKTKVLNLKNVQLSQEDQIFFSSARFITGTELSESDVESVVLEKPSQDIPL